MRRPARPIALLLVMAALVAGSGAATAAGEDSAAVERESALVGEQFILVLEVAAPADASVTVDPVAGGWRGVRVVDILSTSYAAGPAGGRHRLELLVAGFIPGTTSFVPAVLVTSGGRTEERLLPPVELAVLPSLAPGEPLVLSPLSDLEGTGGARSPLLVPGLVVAGAGAVALLAGGLVFGGGWVTRRWRGRARRDEPPQPPPEPRAGLATAEALLGRDLVEGYRLLARLVRLDLRQRYGIPATALTALELRERMDEFGVDRWQARLVRGLLEECDAVVYAGYRPAPERLEADLNVAREILGGAT